MEYRNFKNHKCVLTPKGFDTLPDEVIQTCKEAVIFYMYDGEFILSDAEAFSEFSSKIYSGSDRSLLMLRRHVYKSFTHFDSVEDLVEILWDQINSFEKKYVGSEAIEIEMHPCILSVCDEKINNHFIDIKILGNA